MKTIGHHTCLARGGKEFVLNNAPFFAEHKPDEGKSQFLGSGYYFWDDNIELAEYWGNVHYKKHYNEDFFIIEAEINYLPEIVLDLVGSRQDMRMILETRDILKEEYEFLTGDWCIGELISLLIDLHENDPRYSGIFPYKAIRAMDNIKNVPNKILFTKGKKNYTILSPRYVICLLEVNEIVLQTKKFTDYGQT